MPRPDRTEFRELQLGEYTRWDRFGTIERLLADLAVGSLADAGLLWDQMLRDDRIRGVMGVRSGGTLGKPLRFDPAADTRKGIAIAEEAEGQWSQMAPKSELEAVFVSGLGLNCGLARLRWDKSDGYWVPRLKAWHPSAVRYDHELERYLVRHRDGEAIIEPGDPNWLLFTPHGYGRHSGGLMSPLSMCYMARLWCWRDRGRHSEIHGQGVRQGITPADATKEEKAKFKAALAAVGTETVVVTPQGSEGNRWDVKLIEAMSNSHMTFSAQMDHIDAAIAIVVLGQSTSTTGQPGLGSQEKAGDSVRSDVAEDDNGKFGECLRDQLLGPWARFEHGTDELAPRPCWEVKPQKDMKAQAEEYKALGDGCTALEPHGVDTRQILEDAGVPMLTEEEIAQKKADAAARAMAAMQQQGVATPQKPNESNPTPKASDKDAEEPTDEGAVGDSPKPKDADAVLMNRAPTPAGERRRSPEKVRKNADRGLAYAERVRLSHQAAAVSALAPTLDEIKAEVAAASTFEDARRRLLKKYRGLDGTELEGVLRKALVMSNLRGRVQVMEDL
jgi:phage gp29-like protein